MGNTPIPATLGTTVTGAIYNLNNKSGIGTWTKLGEGIDTFTVDYGSYTEYLFLGGYASLTTIKSGCMMIPREVAELSPPIEILVFQANDDTMYGRIVCNPTTQKFTKDRSQDTGLLVTIFAR